MKLQSEQRQRVVAVAHSFLRTPYHHQGMLKGIGVDCLTLLALVYEEAGLIEPVALPPYSRQFMHHRSAELYLEGLLKYTVEIDTPQPGDIALWKFGRCFSHAAIVIQWPTIIHAYVGRGCVLETGDAAWLSHIGENTEDKNKPRPRRFFSYWKER